MTCLSKAFASQSRRDGPALQPLWAQMMSARPGPASGQGGRGTGGLKAETAGRPGSRLRRTRPDRGTCCSGHHPEADTHTVLGQAHGHRPRPTSRPQRSPRGRDQGDQEGLGTTAQACGIGLPFLLRAVTQPHSRPHRCPAGPHVAAPGQMGLSPTPPRGAPRMPSRQVSPLCQSPGRDLTSFSEARPLQARVHLGHKDSCRLRDGAS